MLFVANFGWAKPVPVDPGYFRNPNRDMLLVALAGPVSNLILAFVAGMALRFAHASMLPLPEGNSLTIAMLQYGLFINLILAFFNLIPIPPLDGSKILRSLLPPSLQDAYLRFEPYGPFVLLGLIVLGRFSEVSVFWLVIGPFVQTFTKLFAGSASYSM
jgi:Zn-dependent protease